MKSKEPSVVALSASYERKERIESGGRGLNCRGERRRERQGAIRLLRVFGDGQQYLRRSPLFPRPGDPQETKQGRGLFNGGPKQIKSVGQKVNNEIRNHLSTTKGTRPGEDNSVLAGNQKLVA